MRNIYFVEFGNYDGENVSDKIIFPVSAKKLSMAGAEEKLSHLKSILHKNCVVSISDGVVSGEFTELYNLETGTLTSYEVNYVLISCIERDISTENFPTFAEARGEMIKEVLKSIQDDESLLSEYYEFQKANGNYDGDDFGIYTTSAWANADGGDQNCDWRIIVC